METKRKLLYIAGAVLIVLVVALGLLTACTSEALVAYEAPAVGTAPASYTLTVQATKGEAVTSRALSLDSGVLNASWTKDDVVMVYDADGAELGSLTAASSGVETMLEGTLTTLPANGDVLTLKFLSPEYANQGGTLEYIAANCDYATASVTVLGIDGTVVTTTGAVFENQQSIVKFTLQDNEGTTITATDMIVVADGNTYSIHTTLATSEFFVALPALSGKTISMAASNGTDNYIFDRKNATIESGKYYTLTMQMDKLVGNLVNLSTLTDEYVAQNGDILMGTIDHTKKITIAAGASITLYNASINADGDISNATEWAGITCLGDATITLVGENVVKGCNYGRCGIQAGTLTIDGTGSLTSTGGYGAAGIGSGWNDSCGAISIIGGNITSTGGEGAAGIGNGWSGNCGAISISGGNITATGGKEGPGIGSGNAGRCGDISIIGGNITATGGEKAAGIGSGWSGNCVAIRISGGDITATGGEKAAGIGSGYKASCGNITINGTASGTAKRGENSLCDIGAGVEGTCGTVRVLNNTISGGHLVDFSMLFGDYEAQDGDMLTGTIDNTKMISIAAGASITLNNVSINAGRTLSDDTPWAGITCLGNATITLVGRNVVNECANHFPGIQAGPANTTLTIDGTGSLTATGGQNAAGIGSGKKGSCGVISISGGNITATGGIFAAGIGSGDSATCGNISITGGTITATGGMCGAGIGSGDHGSCGDISISGGNITATGGGNAAGIGSGSVGSCGSISISGTASGSATRGTGNQYDIGPGSGSTCGTVIVESNNFSGSYYVAPTPCTFTLKFYEIYNESESGVMIQPVDGYNAKAGTIKVTVNGVVYTSTGTYNNNDTVTINLPTGTDMTLTITAPNAEYWDHDMSGGGYPKADFSATMSNVTITEGSENNLGTVNLVKQLQP